MYKLREAVMAKVFFICACASVFAILLICFFLFTGGIPAIGTIGPGEFFLGTSWRPVSDPPSFGILPMITGSILITLGAIVLGVPVGIFTAIFLAHMCPRQLYVILKPVVNLLAGIPSVVYGFFGMIVLVPIIREISQRFTGGGTGMSMLTASLLLGIMILPVIIAISESAIRAIPDSYYEGALALGASHTRSIFFVVVPAAKSGILASVILGIGRSVGETMAVVMVAGNQPRMPVHLFRGARSMTANIVMEMGYATGIHRDSLIATAVVLFIFILLINITFTIVSKRGEK